MNRKFARILPIMIIGIALIVIGLGLSVANIGNVAYIIQGVGIILTLIFCALAGLMFGRNKK